MGTKELSKTAYLIAWGRSKDPDLSLDPYARLWLTDQGIAYSEKLAERVAPSVPYFLCLRSRYLVELLRAFERSNPGFTLMNVASGLSSYPFLLSDRSSTVCFDQPHVLDHYRGRVDDAIREKQLPQRNIDYVPVNLNSAEGVEAVTQRISAQDRPCFILFEGILSYLEKSTALEMIRKASELARPGSRMIVHVFLSDFDHSPVLKRINAFLSEELGIAEHRFTYFDEQDFADMPGMTLIEHVGFEDMHTRWGRKKPFDRDGLIDERFFLFEKK